MRFLSILLGTSAFVSGIRLTINPMKHSVVTVTRSDFDAVISKFRDRQISVVYFYRPEESDSSKYFEPYNQVAAELRGMFKFAAVDCDDQEKLCKDEGATAGTLPQVVVYPMRPLPAEHLSREDMEKLGDEKGLKKTLYKLLSSEHVKILTEDKLEGFLSVEEQIPKVILFSNKKSTPPLYKAISTEFAKEMSFGFFPAPSETVLKKFKLKESNLPKIVLQETTHQGKRKSQNYDGELTFQAIHEWANLRRETFARGGGFDHTLSGDSANPSAPAPKPWLAQEIPEMYKQSHKDICFKFDEGLCVIYLAEGAISDQETQMLKKVKLEKSDDSIHFRFMWLNVAVEKGFRDLFNPEVLPNVVVFNPHKRLRFAGPLEEPASEASIQRLVEKIAAGEGRFKMVPGQTLPGFAERKKTEEESQRKEEL